MSQIAQVVARQVDDAPLSVGNAANASASESPGWGGRWQRRSLVLIRASASLAEAPVLGRTLLPTYFVRASHLLDNSEFSSTHIIPRPPCKSFLLADTSSRLLHESLCFDRLHFSLHPMASIEFSCLTVV